MNTHIMLDWIKNYLNSLFSKDKKKLLILDSAPAHRVPIVKETLHSLGFDILMIPGGCTKYLQPLDRSFKSKLKSRYVTSLSSFESGKDLSQASSNRQELYKNIRGVWGEISKETVLNGWRRVIG